MGIEWTIVPPGAVEDGNWTVSVQIHPSWPGIAFSAVLLTPILLYSFPVVNWVLTVKAVSDLILRTSGNWIGSAVQRVTSDFIAFSKAEKLGSGA